MPSVKIDLAEGKERTDLMALSDAVMDTVVELLQLLPDDRNIIVQEHPAALFRMKPPYEILIEIRLFEGRSKETKRKLYRELTGRLEEKGITRKEKVMIILNEIKKENWGIRGGLPADEIDLGYRVDI